MFGPVTAAWNDLRRTKVRPHLHQVNNLIAIGISALMIWKGLIVATQSESPVVVVLSGSMRPAFDRGDLLFLTQDDGPFRVGEVVVFKLHGRDIPIVHRVIRVHEREGGEVELLTKGDDNRVDDTMLYTTSTTLKRSDVIGRCRAYLPLIGGVTVLLNDYPIAKYIMLSVLGLVVLTTKE
eukprot:TRINITY_DN1847_c0_g1_i1.p1 TRINITY_DN1847_c0_g1~~TRINITY_DN1847_c0_g1_i1.p1  ORF type:complete len:180 (+),score=55.78 TRINITY_DN1847_c0_g1_i1:39-578(+)